MKRASHGQSGFSLSLVFSSFSVGKDPCLHKQHSKVLAIILASICRVQGGNEDNIFRLDLRAQESRYQKSHRCCLGFCMKNCPFLPNECDLNVLSFQFSAILPCPTSCPSKEIQ